MSVAKSFRTVSTETLDFIDVKPANLRPSIQLGNRCGHDPENPRFDMIERAAEKQQEHRDQDYYGKKFRPKVLRVAGERSTELYTNPERHLNLAMHNTGENIIECRGANRRLIRSEGRENYVLVLSVMALHMDLTTMMVRYHKDGEWFNYTYDWLASQAGMSLSRFKRGVAFWKEKGFIVDNGDDDKVCELNEDGTYSGRACPKTLREEMFQYFGLGEWLKHERKKSTQRQKEAKEAAKLPETDKEKALAEAQRKKTMNMMRRVLDGKATGDKRIDNARSAADILSDF